jgi:hypothetical protein
LGFILPVVAVAKWRLLFEEPSTDENGMFMPAGGVENAEACKLTARSDGWRVLSREPRPVVVRVLLLERLSTGVELSIGIAEFACRRMPMMESPALEDWAALRAATLSSLSGLSLMYKASISGHTVIKASAM